MRSRFFLNLMKPVNCTLAAPHQGEWTSDEFRKDFLINYSQSIELGRAASGSLDAPGFDVYRTQCVPSVFARPILFSEALADASHPMHEAVRSQWRGFVAAFALRQVLDLRIESSQYEVPRMPEAARADPADRNLNVILRSQLPVPTADWEKWWVFRCGSSLIGATSPWTIVYTPAEYRVPDAIPWRGEDGLFIDPIRFFDPGERRDPNQLLAMLFQWVDLLLRRFNDFETPAWRFSQRNLDKAINVQRALHLWHHDLRPYVDMAPRTMEMVPTPMVDLAPGPYAPFPAAIVGSPDDRDRPGGHSST